MVFNIDEMLFLVYNIVKNKETKKPSKNNFGGVKMYSVFSSGSKKNLDKKTVKISSKRQITIPQKFFKILKFNDVAECILRDGEIVIRPAMVSSEREFAEDIIKELLAEGFSGEEFISEFKMRYKRRTIDQE